MSLWTRRHLLQAGATALSVVPTALARAGDIGKPERSRVSIGLAVDAASFTPAYVADARTWKEVGLDVEMSVFRGDAEVAQALAGGSVDISLQSMDGLFNLLNASQPVIGFYAGCYQADFAWYAQPNVKNWADIKGGTIGISTFGSLVELLAIYVLRRHGLEPTKDVRFIQVGPSSSSFQGLKSGRLTAATLPPPFKWMAADQGYTLLGTEADEVAKQWPKHIFIARTKFIDENPKTLETFLRGWVAAIRLARANRDLTTQILVDRLKWEPTYAARAYDEMMPDYNERGTLPEAYMKVFWEVEKLGNAIKAPIPESKLLDDRFIKTFDQWAP
jgi:ABC-type nitrate/sulfonate/bicarbonate transport system substrate-binding protein